MSEFKFLDKVFVSRFTTSQKRYDDTRRCMVRSLSHAVNEQGLDIYTVVGITCLKEGDVSRDEEGDYLFNQRESHKVYIVAKTIGRRKYALSGDMVLVEEAANDE